MRAQTSALKTKDLLGIEQLSPDEITLILDTAEGFKEVSERPVKKVPALRGQLVINLFMEASTRTRVSFEIAEKRLSADTLNFSASGSSVEKGETLIDTAENLMAMRPDMIVIRDKHHAEARPPLEARCGRHAPRPDEPRRGDRLRRRRQSRALGHPRAGDERGGGADGGVVSARRSAPCGVKPETRNQKPEGLAASIS